MSILSVFQCSSPQLPYKVLTHHDDIVATLAEHGVRFAHQSLPWSIRPGNAQQQVCDEAGEWIDGLMAEHGATSWTLLDCKEELPDAGGWREEHVHDALEVFAVMAGRAQISLRVGDQVFAVLCERGDILHVPAEIRRWIDLGDRPFCLALRLTGNGQPAKFTGDDLCRELPGMAEL